MKTIEAKAATIRMQECEDTFLMATRIGETPFQLEGKANNSLFIQWLIPDPCNIL